jgi:succinate-semialdehyde dehydrogenase/glutarate-semialdehyde dehydrogenase
VTTPPAGADLLRAQAYVGGAWVAAITGRTFPVDDPATGAVLAEVPAMAAEDTRRAIAAAQAAFPNWAARPAKERAKILRCWADAMLDRREDLARLMSAEQGKPQRESRAEIDYAASFLEWFGEEAKRVYGDTIPTYERGKRVLVLKQPIGVTAGITPWNFPAAMITRKAAPALAAGCTMIVKPAEQTPLTALAICALGEQAGLPPGVFNVITADAESAPAIGVELTTNPIIRKVGFTGSSSVGRVLMRQCADQITRIGLELGGNAPFVVFDDADLDAAVAGAIVAKYRNGGQACNAANRMLVQDTVIDEFVERFGAAVAQLTVGPGCDERSDIGPLIDDDALAKVERHVDDARGRGGQVVVGGRRHALGGRFFEATVLVNAPCTTAAWSEETFGPVAMVYPFRDEAEAIELANATPYGLAMYFYSRDLARVWRVCEAVEFGIVGVNTGLISTEVAPFGGVKQSGMGREGSKYGIDEWLELKYVCLGGLS